MTAYTEGTLNKLSKREITGSLYQSETRLKLTAMSAMMLFKKFFVKLKSEINIVKQVRRVVDLEWKC